MRKMIKQVISAFEADTHEFKTQYYGVIKTRGKEFTLTTFAVSNTKRYGLRVCPVNRSWSDRSYYVAMNLYKNIWGQTTIGFDERRFDPSIRYNGKWGNKESYSRHNNDAWLIPYVRIVNIEELDNTAYKYCSFGTYNGTIGLAKYCQMWQRFPAVENLVKAGLSHLVNDFVCEKITRNKALVKFIAKNAQAISAGCYGLAEIETAFEKRLTLDDAREYCYWSYKLRGTSGYRKLEPIAVAKYCASHDISVADYTDYLRRCDKCGIDVAVRAISFPRDFDAASAECDRNIKRAKALEEKKRRQYLERVGEELDALLDNINRKLNWRVGNLSAVVPSTEREFVSEGNIMHNCIGSYYLACANGEKMCFFIRKDGEPFADVEMSNDGKVLQCRINRNMDADKDTNRFAGAIAKELAKKIKEIKAA